MQAGRSLSRKSLATLVTEGASPMGSDPCPCHAGGSPSSCQVPWWSTRAACPPQLLPTAQPARQQQAEWAAAFFRDLFSHQRPTPPSFSISNTFDTVFIMAFLYSLQRDIYPASGVLGSAQCRSEPTAGVTGSLKTSSFLLLMCKIRALVLTGRTSYLRSSPPW